MQKSAGTRPVKVSTTGGVGGTGAQTQADMPPESGLIYLLLDVAMGDGNGARGSVEEIRVGGNLTRLHRTCTAQLLHRSSEKVKQQ